MSSRFLIPALCVGAIALACGPRAHNESSAPRKNDTPPVQMASRVDTPNAPAAAVAPKTVKAKTGIDAQLYVHVDTNIRFALHVINAGKKRVEINFPSGQTYDFVVLDSVGREMWHWASGRMFTQTLRNRLLAGGESLDLEETWNNAALPPGKYVARATLKSANYPVVRETEFSIAGTTIASR
jgi:Intracellular proteinase inhibitor